MNREFIEELISQNVKIFSVSRVGHIYYINLNHPNINWDNYSNFYLYSSMGGCELGRGDYDYGYDIIGLGAVCSFSDIIRYNDKITLTSKKINKPKINKSKVVKEIKEDKFGTNLVLELRNQEIYLSNALLSYLDLKDGSKVNFASEDETNQNYLYIETEDKEGYEIKDNIIVCPHNVILFKTLFGTDVLYLDIREENLAEEPSYVFYPVSEENPLEIKEKPKSYGYSDNWGKTDGSIYKSIYTDTNTITSKSAIGINKSSPKVAEKVSELEPISSDSLDNED